MADLLLTHGYFLCEDSKEQQIMKPYVPLGILYISAYLRTQGFSVEVFDSTFSRRDDLFAVLHEKPPGILGIYANLMTRRNVVQILHVAREAGWRTVVGGPEPGAYIEEYLRAGADAVVIGEGEHTMAELLPALRSGQRELSKIQGIAFLATNGAVQETAPRPQIPDLDALPWPAREQADIPRYIRAWREAHGKGSVSIITARGCPYRCRWCSHQVFGMTHRRRKPAAVVDEVEWLLHTYQPDMLWIADDVFTIHHGWLRQYAAEMQRRALRIPFECISRADRVNAEAADLLAELGCFRIWIGSESGSQRILDAMERGVTVEQVQTAIRLCRERGMQTGMFLMWGYEGEEISDIEATVEHVKRSNPDIFFTTIAYPIKGTPYYHAVADRVAAPAAWAETSDRELSIRGRHSRRYYQFADQLLRSEVELARIMGGSPQEASIAALKERVSAARKGLRASCTEVEA
jgi:anaerobic magnesium-protoporphyrin IX monomethyl ester cyclase